LAFDQSTPDVRTIDLERSIVDYLGSIDRNDCDAHLLLDELAQWYGILVPTQVGYWSFVHRTIQDYLAAKWWVYREAFSASRVSRWNYRTAYAACLIEDATPCLVAMLRNVATPIAIFAECLYNQVRFNPDAVAEALSQRVKASNFKYEIFQETKTGEYILA